MKSSDTSTAAGPLRGVRILDMATVLAAPFAATLCGDMGAEVVKLELPNGHDPLRALAPVMGEHSLFWKVTNRGKKGITLDVRKPEGRELFLKLLPDFDVLVENFRTGTLERWGLDIETLHRHNPGLVVLRLTGFGQTGPYASRPGFARIFEAMSGFAHLTGEEGRPPQHMNYPLGDVIAGLFGAFAISTALAGRARNADGSGLRGCEVDLSATEALFRLLDPLAAEFQHMGLARSRAGSRATYTAPSNIYETGDGHWLTLVGSSDVTFMRLCAAMGRPELANDERFITNAKRIAHMLEIDDMVTRWCASLPLSELSALMERHLVPYSKVYTIEDIVNDEQVKARQAIIQLPDADLGEVAAPCAVPRFKGYDMPIPRTGPAAGEHNAEVYAAAGLGADEIQNLSASGVI
ncbi:MAG: CoA transferase [Pseudomonadota bacterium]